MHPLRKFLFVHCAEAEEETRLWIGAIVRAERCDGNAGSASLCGKRDIVYVLRQARQQVDSRIRWANVEHVVKLVAQGAYECVAARAVEPTHSRKVAFQFAGLDESRNSQRVAPGGMPVASGARPSYWLYQPVRQHCITKAHCWIQRLGEGAKVDNFVVVIQPAQGLQRLAFEAKVAVIIVLY